MNTKNILIVVAVVLGVGLAIVIFLSFQVVHDTESAVKKSSMPSSDQKAQEKTSIYGLDLPLGEKKVVHVYGKENPKEGEPSTPIPKNHIKNYELEKAELATGLQSQQMPAATVEESPISSSSPTVSQGSGSETGSTQNNNVEATKEQIRDLDKKGIGIF